MQVVRIFGTPVRVDASWFFIFALFVWTLSSAQGPLAHVSAHWRMGAATIAVIALFVCVVAHEFAHVLVARSFGIFTQEIVLFAFGGVSKMERVGSTAGAEAQIAAAGPAMSLCIGAVCASLAPLLSADTVAYGVVTFLAIVNVTLAFFNFVPAYPVDGGRLLHALAWRITGDRIRATQIAVKFSSGVGILMAAGGLALVFGGYVINGVWIALLAWFVIRAAQAEYAADVEIEPLGYVKCSDLLDADPLSFQPDMTCAQALTRMIETRRRAVSVTVGCRLIGMLALDDFAKLGRNDPAYVYVSAIMTPVAELQKLTPDISGLEAFKQLASSGHSQLPVVDKSGALVGFITRETFARVLSFGSVGAPALVPLQRKR